MAQRIGVGERPKTSLTDEVEEKNGTAAQGECRGRELVHGHDRAVADGACASSSRRAPTSN